MTHTAWVIGYIALGLWIAVRLATDPVELIGFGLFFSVLGYVGANVAWHLIAGADQQDEER